MWKKVKLLKMSNFTFFHNVFYAICILKSFNSHISVVVCNFFEFGTVSKWCIREWVNVVGCVKNHTNKRSKYLNHFLAKGDLKVALQILGRKFYKNTKKTSLYSHSLLIFIHKTPVVENHPTTRENRELLRPRSTPTGITVYFYMSISLIYILEIHRRKFQTLRLMKTLWKTITYLLCYGI